MTLTAVTAALAALALAAPAAAPGPRGTGRASFKQGGRTYRLPLETVFLEELGAPGRTEVHASLVFRDATNRVLALAFVHRGRGPVAAAGSIGLTASTPSGVSRYDAGGSRCDLEVTAAGPGLVEGKGRCRGLKDYAGERAPDVTDVRFLARETPRSAPPETKAATRNPG